MKVSWFFRLIAAFTAIVLQVSSAHAGQHYSAIYVFGDSYCDIGNIYAATHGTKPLSPPYYEGRFSNGPLWVEHLAGSFHLPLKAYLAGGTDFAFGGADLLQDVPYPGGFIPSVQTQVGLYLQGTGYKADPDALYVLEGGGNDVLNATSGSATQLGDEIAVALAGMAVALQQAGATHLLIPNLFNVGLLPAGRANAAFDNQAILEADKELAKKLVVLSYVPGVTLYSPDIYALAQALGADPNHFGFSGNINPCLNAATGTVCADPAHTLFWDADHLTSFGHAFLAVATNAMVHP